MDDIGQWSLFLVLWIAGILFCIAESALASASEGKLQKLADSTTQKYLDRILKTPLERQATHMECCKLICVTGSFFSGFIAAAPALRRLSGRLPAYLEHPALQWAARIAAAVLLLVLLIAVIFSTAIVLPKWVQSSHSVQFPFRLVCRLTAVSFFMRPAVFLTVKLSGLLVRVFGFDKYLNEEKEAEEEIRSLLDESGENGGIEEEEREMIHNIFDFDDLEVSDVMTHRTDIIGLDIHATISDIVYHAINDGFSRIPVYENDLDNIKGIIYVKDLLCLVGCESYQDFQIDDFMRKAIYVPKAQKCFDLMETFKREKAHMAVVVDDYGGTAGIVSMEDLLESIVGSIQDEYDDEQEQILVLGDGTYEFDGSVDLEEVEELFDTEFEADEEIDTLAGLLTNTMGRIPEDNETPEITINQILFTVLQAKDNRIERIRAEQTLSEQEPEE